MQSGIIPRIVGHGYCGRCSYQEMLGT